MNKQKPPQKQHYLPVVYLRQFSVDGWSASRLSKIWRLSGIDHQCVPVDSQCHERFFYSATDAAGAEQLFQTFEETYGGLVGRIWGESESRGDRDYFGLILMILSLHIRNPAYENRQRGTSRIEAYKLLEQQVVHHVLMRGSPDVPTDQELLALLKHRWRVRLLATPPSSNLITSDNPSVWYTATDSGDPHFMILPVTPLCCAVAFDRGMIDVRGSLLTEQDVETLNKTQAKSMLNALYGHTPFAHEDLRAAPEYWQTHVPPAGFIDETFWDMNVLRYTGSLGFVHSLAE